MTVTAPIALPRLLTWLSPAFPTGAFAYSHGLETAIDRGVIGNRAQLVDWVSDLLLQGSLWSDAVLVAQAWRADGDHALRTLADFAAACASSRERQEETLVQGAAFARAISVWGRLPDCLEGIEAVDRWPLPVVIGAALRAGGIGEQDCCLGAAHAAVANLVSAAVRLIPLGQTDGLRCLAALEPVLLETTRRSATAPLDAIGGCCFLSDITAMWHETQATRLFRT